MSYSYKESALYSVRYGVDSFWLHGHCLSNQIWFKCIVLQHVLLEMVILRLWCPLNSVCNKTVEFDPCEPVTPHKFLSATLWDQIFECFERNLTYFFCCMRWLAVYDEILKRMPFCCTGSRNVDNKFVFLPQTISDYFFIFIFNKVELQHDVLRMPTWRKKWNVSRKRQFYFYGCTELVYDYGSGVFVHGEKEIL